MRLDTAKRQKSKRLKLFLNFGLGIAAALLRHQAAAAEEPAPAPLPVVLGQRSILECEVSNAFFSDADPLDSVSASQSPRIRLQRMLPGFLSDPPSLTGGDDLVDYSAPLSTDSGPNWMTVSFGDDNPYLDPRRAGDPGGVGFLHIHSQVQLVDSGSTSVCFGLRGWTPAGLESGGVQQGRTILAPGLGIYQDLGAGNALQGFVDQNLRNVSHQGQGPLRCGMALNCPLTPLDDPTNRSVFFYVQALGNCDYGSDRQGRPLNWEVVPGLHWRMSDNFWMSLGASKSSMLTCGWHY